MSHTQRGRGSPPNFPRRRSPVWRILEIDPNPEGGYSICMITYQQSTGQLRSSTGDSIATGYSGNGLGLNNPAMDNVEKVGPIPAGLWSMVSFTVANYEDKGPNVIHLSPNEGTDTHGRSGFLMHGDNSKGDHSASEGCIIMPPHARLQAWAEPDKTIEVIP